MDLNSMTSMFSNMMESLNLLLNIREILDIIIASLKQYFGKAEEPKEA